jgi:tryptophan synthase alpha subunit
MTTDINRIQNIAKHAEGFIYTVTMNATTGEDGTLTTPSTSFTKSFIWSVVLIPNPATTGRDVKDLIIFDINRIQNIAKHAEGFIYTVTMNATTGEDGTFHPKLKDQIKIRFISVVIAINEIIFTTLL